MYEPQNLQRWTLPRDYMGAHWDDYYSSGFGKHRDSAAIDRVNFDVAYETISAASTLDDDKPTIVSEGHWAVGWVEWIAIHQDDEGALEAADELVACVADYPSLDDERLSETEWNEACDAWASYSVRDRYDAIVRSGCDASIFAARRAELPEDDNGALRDYLGQG